jgi:hypothetical protein
MKIIRSLINFFRPKSYKKFLELNRQYAELDHAVDYYYYRKLRNFDLDIKCWQDQHRPFDIFDIINGNEHAGVSFENHTTHREISILYYKLSRRIDRMDSDIYECKNELRNYNYLNKKRIEKHNDEIRLIMTNKYGIDYIIKDLEKKIKYNKKEIKRVYSSIDPYGEEDWER